MTIQRVSLSSNVENVEIIEANELDKKTVYEATSDIFQRAFPQKSYDIQANSLTFGYFCCPERRGKGAVPLQFLIAKSSENILGFLFLFVQEVGFREKIPSPQTLFIPWLAVDPTSHRRGIGTLLMHGAMEKTKDLGRRYLCLTFESKNPYKTEEENRKINTFYESFRKNEGIPILLLDQKQRGNVIWQRIAYDLCPEKKGAVCAGVMMKEEYLG